MRALLDKIFNNKKITFFLPIIVSSLIYVLYAIFGYKEEKTKMLIVIPIMSIFWFFGVFLVIFIQVKNPLCPEGFLDFFEFMVTIFTIIGTFVFVILSLIRGIENLIPITIPVCMTISSLSWAHSKRK